MYSSWILVSEWNFFPAMIKETLVKVRMIDRWEFFSNASWYFCCAKCNSLNTHRTIEKLLGNVKIQRIVLMSAVEKNTFVCVFVYARNLTGCD